MSSNFTSSPAEVDDSGIRTVFILTVVPNMKTEEKSRTDRMLDVIIRYKAHDQYGGQDQAAKALTLHWYRKKRNLGRTWNILVV